MKNSALITTLIWSLASMNYAFSGDISLSVEEPGTNASMTGISNIRGWAVSTVGIDRVELSINGVYKTDIPYGGTRGDVEKNYPGYPDSRYSGFSMAYNYSLREKGENTFTFKVIDNDGASKSITRSFNVAKFQQPFFPESAPLSIDDSMGISAGDDVFFTNVDMLGKKFGVLMGWDKGKQNFTIKDTVTAGYSPSFHDGLWAGYLTPDTVFDNSGLGCAGGYFEFTLSSGSLGGYLESGYGDVYSIFGSVGSDGTTTGGIKWDTSTVGSFSGSVTSLIMGGAWSDNWGCSGRWWSSRN